MPEIKKVKKEKRDRTAYDAKVVASPWQHKKKDGSFGTCFIVEVEETGEEVCVFVNEPNYQLAAEKIKVQEDGDYYRLFDLRTQEDYMKMMMRFAAENGVAMFNTPK